MPHGEGNMAGPSSQPIASSSKYPMPTIPAPISLAQSSRRPSDRSPRPSFPPNGGSTPPPTPPPKDHCSSDPTIQAAREKMSSKDQEAMRKMRSTMLEGSESGSSNPSSPSHQAFPSATGTLRSRTLSKQLVAEPSMSQQTTPKQEILSTPKARDPDVRYTIAVIGHRGVGKTTIINRSLKPYGVSPPVLIETVSRITAHSYTTWIPPGGKLRLTSHCTFIELDMDSVDIEDEKGYWPAGLPPPSGAVLCYDATKKDTLRGIPALLHRLAAKGIPVVMLACKSDPEANVEVDAAHANSLGEPYNVGLIEVTNMTSEGKGKIRNGIRWLVYKLEQRFVRQQRKASQATVDSPVKTEANTAESDTSSNADKVWRHGLSTHPNRTSASSDSRSSASSVHWIMQGPLNLIERAAAPDPEPPGESEPGAAPYETLDSLFNQLFSAIVSTQDQAFLRSFFLTYRRFCTPRYVMQNFLDRYKQVEGYEATKDIKHWALQKLTGALIDWTSNYPGDLADLEVQTLFKEILALVLDYTFMAHLTADLVTVEESLDKAVDLDASWSIKLPNEGLESSSHLSAAVPEPKRSMSNLSVPDKSSVCSASSSSVNELKPLNGSQTSMSDSSDLRQENRLVKQPADAMQGKWASTIHFILITDPRVFASEVTKLQWKLFSVIRSRDVFRHDMGKEKAGPVGQAIDFFNHLSRWRVAFRASCYISDRNRVTTAILAETKAKNRARVYERFMLITQQLRRLNNYDSLYAVISGMRETSVHRLGHTHVMVSAPITSFKDFQSHVKLMDPRGGYTHYRRALSADLSHGRPAIPLLTTVLGMVSRLHSARREDVREDGMVQWDKFAKFGDILAIIPECQARGSPVAGAGVPSKIFEKVMADAPVIHDEDALFERSKMLEPGGPNSGGNTVLKRLGRMAF